MSAGSTPKHPAIHVLLFGTKAGKPLMYVGDLSDFGGWSRKYEVGGAEGGRTPDLRIANAALCQTELLPHATKGV